MDLNYRTNILFSIPTHQFDVNGFSEIQNELIDYVYKMRAEDSVGQTISNNGGWQSKNFNINNEADPLHKFLIDSISSFPVIKKGVNFVIDAWANINKPGDYNVKHDHPTANLSGVLWIKCPKNCGNIVFENPTSFQSFNEINSYTNDFKDLYAQYFSYWFLPTEGRILIFPAYLRHSVEENKSDEDRISVSFNLRLQ